MSDRAQFIRDGEADETKAWRAFGHFIGHWVLHGFGSFVITQKGSDQAIGSAGPWFPFGWPEKEIGWVIWSPEAEGKGIAFEAATAARAHAYQALGWTTAVSYIAHDNARSIALAKRLGATLDPDAATPRNEPCFVYRHPKPELA
jgi:RimJ/RimL family protein N-acetyltransferase